ncbi:MAG TPA: hypothetical protein VF995_01980 [Actinomycetota bacterium]
MSMTRTTVCLTQDTKRRLRLAAQRRQCSEAELVREAIDALLASEPERPRPNLPLFTGVDHTVADRVDDIPAAQVPPR